MPKITLRRFSDDDLELVRLWRNSPDISSTMYGDHTITETEHRSWFNSLKMDETKSYWIIESDGGAIGAAYVYDIDKKHRQASWGFYVIDEKARRAGAGYYVEVFMLHFAFEHLKLNKLNCEVLAENKVIWKMHEKIGFRREGSFRSHIRKTEKYHDVVRLGLLQNEWFAVRTTHFTRLVARGQKLPDFSSAPI